PIRSPHPIPTRRSSDLRVRTDIHNRLMDIRTLPKTLKLNLGCGSDIRPGYLNVDKFPATPEVVQADLPALPFGDGKADEVLLSRSEEHTSELQSHLNLV